MTRSGSNTPNDSRWNPPCTLVPVDIKPRVLTTAIDDEDCTASLERAVSVAPYFELDESVGLTVAGQVARAVECWREEATRLGVAAGQLERMASAFEHDDLRTALAIAGTRRRN